MSRGVVLLINHGLILSLLLIAGAAMANNEGAAPDSENNQAQTLIERASQQFDFFAMQLPLVIKARIEAFMKKGFRAVLIEDPEAAPAEEKKIQSLTDGLRSIGSAFEDDRAAYQRERKGDGR